MCEHYACRPQDVDVRWNSTTQEVWEAVPHNSQHRLLGRAEWVRGISNIKFVCQVHKGVGGSGGRCGFMLSSGKGDEADFQMLDRQCQRWFAMAGAYRSNATRSALAESGKAHHMAEAELIKAYVRDARLAARKRS